MGLLVRTALRLEWQRTKLRDAARLRRQVPPAGAVTMEGLPYLESGSPQHWLNIYRPAGLAGPLPTIVDIHGGGWMYGDVAVNRNYCRWLAAQGYTVVAPNYRLLPATDLAGQVLDLFCALHWLVKNGAEHRCDLDRVYFTGDSAGAQLAGLCACIQRSPRLQHIYGVAPFGFEVRAIGMVHGVCEIERLEMSENRFFAWLVRNEMMRMLFDEVPRRAAWFGHASFSQVAKGLVLPPIFMVSSEADFFHPQTLALDRFLTRIGARHTLQFWTRAMEYGRPLGHVFNVKEPGWPESVCANTAMLRFFDES